MSAPAPPPGSGLPSPSRGGLVAELVARLLGYMDRPWKAAAVILLLTLAGLGFGLWQERAAVRAWVEMTPAPRLAATVELAAELDSLLNTTTVDWASVWALDFGANAQSFLVARRKGANGANGGLWEFRPPRLPALRRESDPAVKVEAMSGRPVCGVPLADEGSLLLRRLAADGMAYFCVLPVPAVVDRLAIGALYLAWRERPEPDLELAALGAAAEAGARMIRR